jgi:hypothetical protein
MTELPARAGVPDGARVARAQASLAIALALAGHAVALLAGATGQVILPRVVIVGFACSVIALAALASLAPAAPRTRRTVAALTGAQGLAAAILAAGLAPSLPPALALAALAAAVAIECAALAILRFAAMADRAPPPLAFTPRVAAIALVIQMALQLWAASPGAVVSPLRNVGFVALAALGIVLLASLTTIALRLRHGWVIAGLAAWTVGWVASMVDLGALILWLLGGTFPVGRHQLQSLDAELVQIIATLGGLVIGAALAAAIREPRFRHSALVLLVGYAVFGVIAALGEHRIDLAADFPTIVALRRDRDLAGAISDIALAGLLWLYWRRVAAAHPGATWNAS